MVWWKKFVLFNSLLMCWWLPSSALAEENQTAEEKTNILALFDIFPEEGTFEIAELITKELGDTLSTESPFFIIRQKELTNALGVDPGKAMQGCGDDILCITQIGNTISVNSIVIGSVKRDNENYKLSVKLIEVMSASIIKDIESTVSSEPQLLNKELKSIARRLIRKTENGSLALQSNVKGAIVNLNGEVAGYTPILIDDLVPGIYKVIVEKPGYKPWRGDVEIKPEEEVKLAVNLLQVEEEAPPPVPLPEWMQPLKKPFILSALGVGGASLIAGISFGISAKNLRDAANREKVQLEAVEKWNKAKDRASLANIFFALAGVSAVTTGVFYYLEYTESASANEGLNPAPRLYGFRVITLREKFTPWCGVKIQVSPAGFVFKLSVF